MPTAKRFSRTTAASIHDGKILGVRAGSSPRRFTGVWVVVVNGRVFVRPWNDKPTGWRRAFADERIGVIQTLGGREIGVRAHAVRGERLLDSVDEAYAEKYHTEASRKWVRGFRTPRRRATTTELVPR